EYCWRAVYSGDATYLASTGSGKIDECFTVDDSVAPPIAFQSGGSFGVYGTSDSQPVTVPGGANRILVFVFAGKVGGEQLNSVTYGGVPLQLLGKRTAFGSSV